MGEFIVNMLWQIHEFAVMLIVMWYIALWVLVPFVVAVRLLTACRRCL